MVLITNRQSNILQDIDSLHLFAQVVSSICRSLDEREILRNAFELLSAFDELVTLGYRENLSIAQIKTFLEMESHEERIQEIISRNKELEATEERKRKAKAIEVQRKEAARLGRTNTPRAPSYPTYTPPVQQAAPTYDSYEAERNKTAFKPTAKGKGMQLGKKNRTTDMFSKVRDDMGVGAGEESAPLVTPAAAPAAKEVAARESLSGDGINVTIAETISATLSREGALKSFSVKGGLKLRITDPSLTKVKLGLAGSAPAAQMKTHPNVDKGVFTGSKEIQLRDASRGFPTNNSVEVVRWQIGSPSNAEAADVLPITFTVWVNKSDSSSSITIEYELGNGGANAPDALEDVIVSIPFSSAEPNVQSFDAKYEMTGDSLDWTIGPVDAENATGSFEFEAAVDDESEFFPMRVSFAKSRPYQDIDVSVRECAPCI